MSYTLGIVYKGGNKKVKSLPHVIRPTFEIVKQKEQKTKRFTIVGMYFLHGIKDNKKVKIESVRFDPHQVIGIKVSSIPTIVIKNKKVIVEWDFKGE